MERNSMIRFGAALAIAMAAVSCASAPPDELIPKRTGNKKFEEDPTKGQAQQPGGYVGGPINTFDHAADLGETGTRDPFDILAQRQEEGPPQVRTRLHSCQKLQYTTLRNILMGFGVDIDATGKPATAGQLVKGGGGALGVANYDARVGETIVWTAAGAAKFFDIFVQAAPEIIAKLPEVEQCKVDGVGAQMFDEDDHCNADAITCLIGRPATKAHVTICDDMVQSASSADTGKNMAVAALLAAAHTCE